MHFLRLVYALIKCLARNYSPVSLYGSQHQLAKYFTFHFLSRMKR